MSGSAAAAVQDTRSENTVQGRRITCSDGAGGRGGADTAEAVVVVALLLAQPQCGADVVKATVRHGRVQTPTVRGVRYTHRAGPTQQRERK